MIRHSERFFTTFRMTNRAVTLRNEESPLMRFFSAAADQNDAEQCWHKIGLFFSYMQIFPIQILLHP
jgi:hypothetical protein